MKQIKTASIANAVFFPTSNNPKTWIAFIEIKDCKPDNISIYKNKVKKQILSTVNQFRQHEIINQHNVYGIISFPKADKLAFNQALLWDYADYKKLFKANKIHFFVTNNVIVKNQYEIDQLKTHDKKQETV